MIKLLILFVSLIGLWAAACKAGSILWYAILSIVSLYFLVKNKNITKNDFLIGILLGMLSAPGAWIMGVVTPLAYLGSISVFRKYDCGIALLKPGEKQVRQTIFWGVGIGIILGIINLFLGDSVLQISLHWRWLWISMTAGIAEEVIFRMLFFAMCVQILKKPQISTAENILCYLIMIIPHVLMHFNLETVSLGNVLVLTLLFGLPFALQQRKRDLTSAMISHFLVDFIRFTLLGC